MNKNIQKRSVISSNRLVMQLLVEFQFWINFISLKLEKKNKFQLQLWISSRYVLKKNIVEKECFLSGKIENS